MTYLIALLATGIAFGIADALWLSNAVPRIYRPMIGELLSDKLNVGAAIAFYLIYICGIVFFAVRPALDEGSLMKAALYGAALGFVAYATYDLTNRATLGTWPWKLALVDMAWGTFLTGAAATLGYLATKALKV